SSDAPLPPLSSALLRTLLVFRYCYGAHRDLHSFPTRRSSDLPVHLVGHSLGGKVAMLVALRHPELLDRLVVVDIAPTASRSVGEDRKSTRLNSSHVKISYAVFCLKKKKKKKHKRDTADDETQH